MHNLISKKPFLTLLISMMIVALVPLSVTHFYYNLHQKTVAEQQRMIVEESLRLNVQQIDRTLIEIIESAMSLDNELVNVNVPPENMLNGRKRLEIHDISQLLMKEIRRGSYYVSGIYLYSTKSEFAIGSQGYYSKDMLKDKIFHAEKISDSDFEKIYNEVSYGRYIPINTDSMIFTRTISQTAEGKPENQLIYVINKKFYTELIDHSNVEDGMYVFSYQNVPLLFSNKTKIDISATEIQSIFDTKTKEKNIHGEPMLLYSLASTFGGYEIHAAIPYNKILEKTEILRKYYWSILAGAIILAAVLSVCLSRIRIKPYHHLMKQYQDAISEKQFQDALRGDIKDSFELPCVSSYAIVCFASDDYDEDRLLSSLERTISDLPDGVRCMTTVVDGSVTELVGFREKNTDEEDIQNQVNLQLSSLIKQGIEANASYSSIHTSTKELSQAFEEASIAMEYVRIRQNIHSIGFAKDEYKKIYALNDWRHLDKQLVFSTFVCDGKIEEAQQTLSVLFPEELLDDSFVENDISLLHLSSVKYQLLHDISFLGAMAGYEENEYNTVFHQIVSAKRHQELYQLIYNLLENLAGSKYIKTDNKDERENQQIHDIKTYIRQHYMDPQINVFSIAEHFGMSANNLSKLFSRKSDQGVLSYIHEVRIEKAEQLLLENDNLTVQEVAERTGYSSILTFNRKFKERFNETPGRYRKRKTSE